VGSVAAPLSVTLQKRQAEILASQPTAPNSSTAQAGMTKFHYLAADGGPHMLLPVEAAAAWSGASSMAAVINPNSDYGRACAATANTQMAAIGVGSSLAIVFADPPMTAWGESLDGFVEIYYLKSWTSTNLDKLIANATAALPTTSLIDSGNVMQLSQPDAFLLFAGDTPDKAAYGVYRIPIPVGKYRILTGTYSVKGESVTIYRLKPPGSSAPAVSNSIASPAN
jgi:hypothetical protein